MKRPGNSTELTFEVLCPIESGEPWGDFFKPANDIIEFVLGGII